MSNPPTGTRNAATAGPRCGVKSAYETAKFQDEAYPEDPAMCKVEIADALPFTLDLIDGTRLPVQCDPAGLIAAYDFATADGGVMRMERRLVEVLPGLSPLDTRTPSYWATSDDTRNRDKVLFTALWNGMGEKDRASFLRNVVGLSDERRVAA